MQRPSGLFRTASARHRQNKEGNAKNTPSFFVDRASFSRRLECGILYIDRLRNAPPSLVFSSRVRAHISYFSFFTFTSSPTLYILQWVNELGVKVFRKKGLSPSPGSSPVPSREYVIWGLHLCMSRSKRGGIALSRSRVKRSVKVEGQKSSPLLRCAQMSCALPVKR